MAMTLNAEGYRRRESQGETKVRGSPFYIATEQGSQNWMPGRRKRYPGLRTTILRSPELGHPLALRAGWGCGSAAWIDWRG